MTIQYVFQMKIIWRVCGGIGSRLAQSRNARETICIAELDVQYPEWLLLVPTTSARSETYGTLFVEKPEVT